MEEELTIYQNQLPDTLEDLAKFLLIAPEKAKALRAEINAIDKLGLAKSVYDQKMEEQRQLGELILDASIRMGELTKKLPKATENKGNQYSGKWKNDSMVENPISKSEAIKELGFSQKQVERFEKLADNQDIVEEVKKEARESNTVPTRTKVLDIAKEREKRFQRDMDQIDLDHDNLEKFSRATEFSAVFSVDDQIINSVAEASGDLTGLIERLSSYIQQLPLYVSYMLTWIVFSFHLVHIP